VSAPDDIDRRLAHLAAATEALRPSADFADRVAAQIAGASAPRAMPSAPSRDTRIGIEGGLAVPATERSRPNRRGDRRRDDVVAVGLALAIAAAVALFARPRGPIVTDVRDGAADAEGTVAANTTVGTSAPTTAESPNQTAAREAYERGLRHFSQGEYGPAVEAFRRAHELAPNFKILYNIARTEEANGDRAAALRDYERYLAEGNEKIPADRRRETERKIAQLKTELGR